MQTFSHQDKKQALIDAPEISHDLEAGLLNPLLARSEPTNTLLLIGADDLYLCEEIMSKAPCEQMTRWRTDPLYAQSPSPWHTITTSFPALPENQAPVDVILMSKLHAQAQDLGQTLQQLADIIKPQGLLIFGTLIYSETTPDFPSLHAIGDALGQHGFSHPIVERHQMTYRFSSPEKKRKALLAIGIQEPSPATSMSLTWAIAHAWRKELPNIVKMPTSRHQHRS